MEIFEHRHKVLVPIRAASRDDNPRDNCYVSTRSAPDFEFPKRIRNW